ncbi:Tetratricopeptide TPR_4 [Minicystis rosea]|nr:Tetratricopeptide TPR_4 [Minicystis rosea]
MGYWTYYLAMTVISLAMEDPRILVGIVVFVVLRPFVPDPVLLVRTWGRIRRLDAQIAANPANVTARRDLALIWMERLRPRRALELLDEARRRSPDDAELLYLTGLARLRSGDAQGALEPVVRAVEIDPRVRFGEPYLVAAEALTKLGRLEEAEDALERYTDVCSSSLQGWVRLSDVRRRQGNKTGAQEALQEAFATWRQVPGYRRRGEFGWWMKAWWARVFG